MGKEYNLLDQYAAFQRLGEVLRGKRYVPLKRVEPKPGPLLEAFSKPGSSGKGQLIIDDIETDITYLRLASPSCKDMLRIHFGDRSRESRVILNVRAGELTISVNINEGEQIPCRRFETIQAEQKAASLKFVDRDRIMPIRHQSSRSRIPVDEFVLSRTGYPKECALYVIPIVPDNQIVIFPSTTANHLPGKTDIPLDDLSFLTQSQVAGLLQEIDPGLNVPTFEYKYDGSEYPDYERIKLQPNSLLGVQIGKLITDWLSK